MDHVVPIAQGGLSTPGNVVPSCKSCNTLKRDMTAVEWLLYLESKQASLPAMPSLPTPTVEDSSLLDDVAATEEKARKHQDQDDE
jgi:HNH endonuclease